MINHLDVSGMSGPGVEGGVHPCGIVMTMPGAEDGAFDIPGWRWVKKLRIPI
jgi:hypothetical protein